MNLKWWLARILFIRWLTGCGGEGYTKNGVCTRLGCH